MSLNWKEIDLVLSELDLPGSRIQKVLQPAFDVLALSLYKEGKASTLLFSLAPGACRLHATYRAVPKPPKPLRFAEFLKSRFEDGWIEEARQLGADRVVRIVVRRAGRGEDGQPTTEILKLYARLWSNAANVIATDADGVVLDAMRRSPKRGEVTGGTYRPEDEERASTDRDFAVRELPGEGSFNERLDAWYAEHAGALSLEALREQARKLLQGRIFRLQASLETLEAKRADYAAADRWKETGDIVMSSIAQVKPGDEWLDTVNFYTDQPVRIKLDGRRSAAANAEHYYDLYRKAKNGLADVEAEIEAGRRTLADQEGKLAKLLAEENPLRLHQALRTLRSAAAKAGGSAKKKRPGLAFRRNGWLLLVGRTAAENDELLRRHVKGSDMWLHARDFPGSYVFVKARPGKTVPLDVLLDAGNLALFYSKGRNAGEGDLYYTQAKHLRRAKDAPKGTVLPTHEKNIRVKVEDARLKALELCREE